MTSVFIRIVILNYNESHYTISLLKQLKKQTFCNYEIVVVDNCSKPNEVEFLKSNLPDDVIAVYSDKNLGYSGGNNLGLKLSERQTIDYQLVLNNDIVIEDENFILTMINGMEDFKSKNVVASSPLIDTISTQVPLDQQIQVRRIMSKWDTFFINIPLFKPFINSKFNHFTYKNEMPYLGKTMLCDSINGAAFIIENHFLKKNDYLDSNTFLYYEEIILGKQILNAGKICLLNGKISIKHLQGASTKSSGKKINYRMEKYKYESSLYYLQKYENFDTISSWFYIFLNEVSIALKRIIR